MGNARRAVEPLITAPTSQQQSKASKNQSEAKLAIQKVQELMREGEKVMLKRDKLKIDLVLAQQSMQVDSENACSYADLEEKARELEKRLMDRAPD